MTAELRDLLFSPLGGGFQEGGGVSRGGGGFQEGGGGGYSLAVALRRSEGTGGRQVWVFWP